MEYHYELNCSQYVLMKGNERLYGPYDQISIGIDKESVVLLKHGEPGMVKNWYKSHVKAYRDAGFDDMANDLIVITGRFPLEDLNNWINNSGSIKSFLKHLGKVSD